PEAVAAHATGEPAADATSEAQPAASLETLRSPAPPQSAEPPPTTEPAPSARNAAGKNPADSPAAAPAPVEPAAPGARPAAATGDLKLLRERWAGVAARGSATPPAKPLIAECRPVSVEDGVVTLGFPESKAFLTDLLEKRRSILEESIPAVLEHSVAVRCVATNIDVLPDLPTDEEAAWILAEAKRIFGEEGADPAEVGCPRRLHVARASHRLHDQTQEEQPMGMGNLQRMALQMQQEMERV